MVMVLVAGRLWCLVVVVVVLVVGSWAVLAACHGRLLVAGRR
jgi:hypothetical protein